MNARPNLVGIASTGDKAIREAAAIHAEMRKPRLIDGEDVREVSAPLRGLIADVLGGKRKTLPTYMRFNAAGESSLLDMWRYVVIEKPASEVLELILDCREATQFQIGALLDGATGRAKLVGWISDAYVEMQAEGLAKAGWSQ